MKIVSVVFHPLLMATYLGTLLLYQTPELVTRIRPDAIPRFLLLVFLLTGLMPAFSVFLLKAFKYISSLEMSNRNERIVPFIFILVYYGIASYLFLVKLEISMLFMILMISSTLLILILTLITLKYKISIHAAAVWSFAGYLTGILVTYNTNLGWIYYAIILAAGLTSTSRLYLGSHSEDEVWAGSILGFTYGYLTIFLIS